MFCKLSKFNLLVHTVTLLGSLLLTTASSALTCPLAANLTQDISGILATDTNGNHWYKENSILDTNSSYVFGIANVIESPASELSVVCYYTNSKAGGGLTLSLYDTTTTPYQPVILTNVTHPNDGNWEQINPTAPQYYSCNAYSAGSTDPNYCNFTVTF